MSKFHVGDRIGNKAWVLESQEGCSGSMSLPGKGRDGVLEKRILCGIPLMIWPGQPLV